VKLLTRLLPILISFVVASNVVSKTIEVAIEEE
jgi:hypothetical protein